MASRRTPTLYTGAAKVFAMSEAHPRWLKATLAAMLSRMDRRGFVTIGSQANEIKHAVERLGSRIRAVPAPNSESSAHKLLERLGSFFTAQVLGERFTADPVLSFVVDDVSADVLRAIEDSMFIGALIPMVEDASGLMHEGIVGRRLRLSYWLAPDFRLPLITGKTAQLSRILSHSQAQAEQLDLGV